VPFPVSGNPARSLELVMQHDLFSSLDSFQALSVAASALLVRDVAGQYRPAEADEVLLAAQQLLAAQVRGSDVMSSPAVVKDFLRARLGSLPHEVFAVVHLDAQNRVLDYVEMFRGTVSQTSVYPREVVRDALLRNSSALLLVHNHPSGLADPSRADEVLTQTLKQAAALIDVRVLDHFIVVGSAVQSMAERGLV
jgi:DNA repair protein RadC